MARYRYTVYNNNRPGGTFLPSSTTTTARAGKAMAQAAFTAIIDANGRARSHSPIIVFAVDDDTGEIIGGCTELKN